MTQRLYQEDSYLTDFDATVLELLPRGKRYAVVLDRTLFYPDSGGQPCDTGRIEDLRIETVEEEGDRILHITSKRPSFCAGARVAGSIDWGRRLTNMQQHTGQHVLSQAFLRALGAATVSSRLGLERSTIDIAAPDLTWDGIKATEDLANAIVYENRPVVIFQAGRDDVEGLRVKMPIGRDVIRVVEVKDFDRSPCGGTHTRATGEIGPIKVLRRERVRDTVRVEFVCGALAMEDYFWKNRFIVDLAQELTTKDRSLPLRIPEMLEERKRMAKEISALRRDSARHRAGGLMSGARVISGVSVVSAHIAGGVQHIREIAAAITENPVSVALLATGADRLQLVFARSPDVALDMREVMTTACKAVGGKGGGKAEVSQGGGADPKSAEEALKEAERAVEAMLP